MLVRKIDHCAVYVRDVEESVRWYEELLGVRHAYLGDTGLGILGSFLVLGDTILAVLSVTDPDTEIGSQHVAFAVDAVDAVYADLVARGYHPEGPPEDLPVGFITGQRSFDVRDPDYVLLEFVQRPAVAPFGRWSEPALADQKVR